MYGYNLKCQLYDTRQQKVVKTFRAREASPEEKNANFVNYMASGGQRYSIETFTELENIKELPYNYNVLIDGTSYKVIIANTQKIGRKKVTLLILE